MEAVAWFEAHPGTAGWVQAFGAIVALATTVWLAWWQGRKAEKSAERDQRRNVKQLFESFKAVSDHAQEVFEIGLSEIRGPNAVQLLENDSWLEFHQRIVTVIDSLPIQQFPDYDTIQMSLDIRNHVHALMRNIHDLAATVRGPVAVSPASWTDALEVNLAELTALNIKFQSLIDGYR